METNHLISVLAALVALVVGGVIGLSFGALQAVALRQHEKRQQQGKLKSGWVLMPGSMGRVALLLITLALVQAVCPLLFEGNTQWWVSGGVVAGYGWLLFRQLLRQWKASKG